MPLLMTIEQAAEALGVGRTTVYKLLKNGDLGSVRIGRSRRIPAEHITGYVRRLIGQIQ